MNSIVKRFRGKKINAYRLLYYLRIIHDFKIEPPIDVDKIIDLLDIEVNRSPYNGNWSDVGYICLNNDKVKIWLNPFENMSEGKERFIFAHELGHLFLHLIHKAPEGECIRDNEKTLKINNFWDIKEYQANTFAAQFLMPASLFNKEYRMLKEKELDKEKLIEELARIFQVPKQAVKFRFISLVNKAKNGGTDDKNK